MGRTHWTVYLWDLFGLPTSRIKKSHNVTSFSPTFIHTRVQLISHLFLTWEKFRVTDRPALAAKHFRDEVEPEIQEIVAQ